MKDAKAKSLFLAPLLLCPSCSSPFSPPCVLSTIRRSVSTRQLFVCNPSYLYLKMQLDCLARRFLCSPSAHLLSPVALPSRRETHLWYVTPEEVRNKSLLKLYVEQLSLDERENIYCMNDDKLQKHALLSRTLVRNTLARYTNCLLSPHSLEFRKNKFGKPEVVWPPEKNWEPPPLQFNISHTSSLIACAVTVGPMIGIDIEEKQRKPRNNILSFARRFFSSGEVDFLGSLGDPDIQQQEFIKLWTIKEAYVKALGKGFWAAPFKDFTIQLRPIEERHSSNQFHSLQAAHTVKSNQKVEIVLKSCNDFGEPSRNWRFALLELAKTHYAAICMEEEDHVKDEKQSLIGLKAWRTVPFVEDEFVSETDAVVPISDLATI